MKTVTPNVHRYIRYVDPNDHSKARSYGEKPVMVVEHTTRAVDLNYGYVPTEPQTQASKQGTHNLLETTDANTRRFGL